MWKIGAKETEYYRELLAAEESWHRSHLMGA